MRTTTLCAGVLVAIGLRAAENENAGTNEVADLGTVVVEGSALSRYRPETVNGATFTDNRYLKDPMKYGCTEAYISYVQNSRGGLDDMRGYIYENRRILDSVEYVCVERELREMVRAVLEENLKETYITSSSENFVEFMHKNATKSNAVKWLCNHLNIPLAQTAACGNADNDADMIACAGIKAAVGNASKSCMAAANIILPPNDSDGVVELLNKI